MEIHQHRQILKIFKQEIHQNTNLGNIQTSGNGNTSKQTNSGNIEIN